MFRFFDFFLWLHCSLLGPYRWPHFLITPNNRLLAVRYQFCPFENCDAGEQVLKDIVRQYNRASFGKPGGNNLSRFTDDRTYILHLLRQELHFRFLEECELIIPIPTSTSLLPIEIVAKAILCVWILCQAVWHSVPQAWICSATLQINECQETKLTREGNTFGVAEARPQTYPRQRNEMGFSSLQRKNNQLEPNMDWSSIFVVGLLIGIRLLHSPTKCGIMVSIILTGVTDSSCFDSKRLQSQRNGRPQQLHPVPCLFDLWIQILDFQGALGRFHWHPLRWLSFGGSPYHF